jgi:hypothetical protein
MGEFFLFDPLDHLHLGTPQNKIRHQEMKKVMFGSPEQPL